MAGRKIVLNKQQNCSRYLLLYYVVKFDLLMCEGEFFAAVLPAL